MPTNAQLTKDLKAAKKKIAKLESGGLQGQDAGSAALHLKAGNHRINSIQQLNTYINSKYYTHQLKKIELA